MALEADKAGSRRESAVWGGMTDKPKTQRQKFTEMVRDLEGKPDEKRLEDRLKPVAQKDVPVSPRQGSLREKPGPAKNVGDETPNPLPDNPSECGGEGRYLCRAEAFPRVRHSSREIAMNNPDAPVSSEESHVDRAMLGPTPDNPSLSLKTRLKRARFFDQRDREVAEGKAEPVDANAGLPEQMVEDIAGLDRD